MTTHKFYDVSWLITSQFWNQVKNYQRDRRRNDQWRCYLHNFTTIRDSSLKELEVHRRSPSNRKTLISDDCPTTVIIQGSKPKNAACKNASWVKIRNFSKSLQTCLNGAWYRRCVVNSVIECFNSDPIYYANHLFGNIYAFIQFNIVRAAWCSVWRECWCTAC